MISQKFIKFIPFIKYCIVGVSGTIIDVLSLYIFVEYFKIPLIPAATLSFILAVINNFLLNKIWTFQNKSKNYKKLFIKFLFISIIGLGINNSLLYLFTNIFGIWYIFSKLLTSGFVLSWNFLANNFWTFKQKPQNYIINNETMYNLSIVIPAYNEAKRITKTLEEISNYLTKHNINSEILVVSDGSKDDTEKVVKELEKKIKNLRLISYKINRGKGYAVKTGILEAKGKMILFTDADNSTPIEEYTKLEKKMQETKSEIVIGSRKLEKDSIKKSQNFLRRFIGNSGNFLIQLLVLKGIKDTQCGFKLFESNSAKRIFKLQKIDRWGFDIESLSIAKRLGIKIEEVSVNWYNDTESKLNPVRDSLRTLKELLYIKFNLITGRYSED